MLLANVFIATGSAGAAAYYEGGSYIGDAAAREAAFANAGAAASSVPAYSVELDTYRNSVVYDVEFQYGDKEYEYRVDACSGAILSNKSEYNRNKYIVDISALISADDAKQAAVDHAGIAIDSATFTDVELKKSRNVMVYGIEFLSGGAKYKYTIDAATGTVATNGNYGGYFPAPSPKPQPTGNTSPGGIISRDDAKGIALNHSGVNAGQARKLEVEYKNKKNAQYYEVEFKVGNMEYDYKIDAVCGSVLKSEIDRD